MKITNNNDIRIRPLTCDATNVSKSAMTGKNFANIFKNAIQDRHEIKFSKHAQARMTERNINLSQSEMDRISDAVNKADTKGIKDSLILLDKLALIVNVPSKTIVTTLDEKSIKENIFTNIDGAVIL